MREGETADCAYVVAHGRLSVTRADGGTADVGPGDPVGELALLRRGRRAATVTAVRDARVVRVGAAAFREVVRTHPEALMSLSARLAEGVASTTPDKGAPVRTIAVVGAGIDDVRLLGRFARNLTSSLGRLGRTKLVSRRLVADLLSEDAPDSPPGEPNAGALAQLLERLEADHDYLVFQADATASAWTQRCARQADAIVVVADADAAPAPVAADLVGPLARGCDVNLVLLRSSGPPRGADRWTSRIEAGAHHHVQAGDASDVHRVARALTGRSVGVVLGGGGPRGFAHLGVLQALDEAGVAVDHLGGTSMGAILAAGYAMGWDHRTRVERTMEGFVNTRFLMRPTIPMASLMSARRLTAGLRRTFGDQLIEDMPLPLFAVSANISRAEQVVHDNGAAWFALRASSSLPGVLPPVQAGGDLLVDGGVVNNLPTDVMRQRAGVVIAVDLQRRHELKVEHDFGPAVTGLQVLRRRLNPFAPSLDVPGPIALLLRAKDVAGIRAHRDRLDAEPADLILRPPVTLTGALDFKAGPALIELGYRYAMTRLESWMSGDPATTK